MKHTSNALGNHLPQNGEGLTVQDLYEVLRVMTITERRKSYISCGMYDVIGISIAQSNQAECGELKVHIKLDAKGENAVWDT